MLRRDIPSLRVRRLVHVFLPGPQFYRIARRVLPNLDFGSFRLIARRVLGMVSRSGFFRFSSAAKHTRDSRGFPHITLIPLEVGNLRQRWYVDGIGRMEFNHGVPMITL